MKLMTQSDAADLLNTINAYCSQDYNIGVYIFSKLEYFKNDFPSNCFYNGIAYRKANSNTINTEINTLKSCSKNIKSIQNISFISKVNARCYKFECKNGYDLLEIVLWLINNFNLKEPNIYSIFGPLKLLHERIENESEVIAKIPKNILRI